MENEMHPAVKLLLARMESNPEEFSNVHTGQHRWRHVMDKVFAYSSKEEKQMLDDRLRDIVLGDAHKEIMQELLNGDDKYEDDFEMKLMQQRQQMLQQQTQMQLNALQQSQQLTYKTTDRYGLSGLLKAHIEQNNTPTFYDRLVGIFK